MRRSTICVLFSGIMGACGSTPAPQTGGESSGLRSDQPEGDAGPDEAISKVEEDTSTSIREGTVSYMAGGTIFQLDVRDGAKPVNLSLKLNALAMGQDDYLAVSRNGEFLTISTTRFTPECSEWACLAIVSDQGSKADSVLLKGVPVRPSGHAAVSNDGNRLVFAGGDGPHAQDLFLLERNGEEWVGPRLITEVSPHNYNTAPVLNSDGTRVLFDCGPVPYGQAGTGICEILVEGLLLTQVVDSSQHPDGKEGEFLAHHGDYLPDGAIVFEADWNGSQLWTVREGDEKPIRLNSEFSNDNMPCVLPGGYIASLWLERPGAVGASELKIAQSDGKKFVVLTPNLDVASLSCHATVSP